MKRFVLFTALLVAVGCSQTGPQGDAGKGTPSPAPNPGDARTEADGHWVRQWEKGGSIFTDEKGHFEQSAPAGSWVVWWFDDEDKPRKVAEWVLVAGETRTIAVHLPAK